MPSSINSLIAAAGLALGGTVPWGESVPERAPGVYLVATTSDPMEISSRPSDCPLSSDAVGELLEARPELRLDGARPRADLLSARISEFWLPDEVVLYIGLAGTALRRRVSDYYKTPIGARRPHSGGWFLKTL